MHAFNPSLGRAKQEAQELVPSLGYRIHLRLVLGLQREILSIILIIPHMNKNFEKALI